MATEFSITQFLTVTVKARLEAKLDASAMAEYGTADTIHQALDEAASLPAIYGIYQRAPGEKPAGSPGRRYKPGHRNQIIALRLDFAVVTESYGPLPDGRLGGWDIGPLLWGALSGWPRTAPERGAVGLLTQLEYVDYAFVMRTPDLSRVLHQASFEARAEILTTPVSD